MDFIKPQKIDCKCGKTMILEDGFKVDYPLKYKCKKCLCTAFLFEGGKTKYYNSDGNLIS